jgi:hypothetical protein
MRYCDQTKQAYTKTPAEIAYVSAGVNKVTIT